VNKNIGILGGDLRISKLAMLLAKDGYKVYTYAMEKMECDESIKNGIEMKSTVEQMAENVDMVISSIPLSRDGKTVVTPLSGEEVYIDEVFKKLQGKTFIAGDIKEDAYSKAVDNKIELIDILDIEELAILNAIPTAEGAMQKAMELSEITLHGNNSLVLGYGRIGKILSKMLLRNRGKCILCCEERG